METDDPLIPASARTVPKVDSEDENGRLVLHVRDPVLDFACSDRLREFLSEAVAARDDVIVDVSAVHYADQFGFEALLHAVRACPGTVRYRGARRPLRSLFVLSQLRSLLLD